MSLHDATQTARCKKGTSRERLQSQPCPTTSLTPSLRVEAQAPFRGGHGTSLTASLSAWLWAEGPTADHRGLRSR